MVCVGRGPREVKLPIVHAAVNEIDIRWKFKTLSKTYSKWFKTSAFLIFAHHSVVFYSFRGTFRYSNCYPDAISMISCRNIDISCLITHRFTLKDSQTAFETAKNFSKSSEHPTNAIKVMIKCNDA